MIKSFAEKDTEKLYITGKSKRFDIAVCKTGLRKLDYLNSAHNLNDLKVPPGNKLEALKGKYKGKYSIVLLMASVVISGCASIIHGTTQNISISSNPSGAKVQADGNELG